MRDNSARYQFINVVKATNDFLGEHCAPLSDTDCLALCKQTNVIDATNEALKKGSIDGLKIQLNWSDDNGSTWVQYPKSK